MELLRVARMILVDHEEWLRSELKDWPYLSCFDTCATIENDLHEAFPSYRFTQRRGRFYDPSWQEWGADHTWLEGSGTIVDPTISQFIGGPHLRVFEPTDPAKDLYKVTRGSKGADDETDKRLCSVLAGIVTPRSPWGKRMNNRASFTLLD